MLHHIEISNFRALEKFRMEQLGRVNLLVGTNNCGKTTVLEAINILMGEDLMAALWSSLSKRGEIHDHENEIEYEIEHLFHGHKLVPNAEFSIGGRNLGSDYRVEARVAESDRWTSFDEKTEAQDLGPFDLSVSWFRQGVPKEEFSFPITKRGGLSSKYRLRPLTIDGLEVLFVTTEALSRNEVVAYLEEAMLTPEEDMILAALRTIEPAIERIVPIGASRKGYLSFPRGGVAVKLAGQRVPIGSLGDGIWRLLGITLSLVRARGGVLLVDEIDTGLHYSVLEKMWHLVYETAKRLDVQVFATTHSRDCFESLAAIAQPTGHDVTIQRIERGKPLAVAFSEAEILQAARRGIEVR